MTQPKEIGRSFRIAIILLGRGPELIAVSEPRDSMLNSEGITAFVWKQAQECYCTVR